MSNQGQGQGQGNLVVQKEGGSIFLGFFKKNAKLGIDSEIKKYQQFLVDRILEQSQGWDEKGFHFKFIRDPEGWKNGLKCMIRSSLEDYKSIMGVNELELSSIKRFIDDNLNNIKMAKDIFSILEEIFRKDGKIIK